jgi:hypothetical protein
MNKTLLVFLLRWLIPGLLAVAFLFLPELYVERASSPLASNWLARIFFAIYLINPFVGGAKAIENEGLVAKDFEESQFFVPDKDNLSIMTHLGAVFTVLLSSVVFLLATRVFFPDLGIWRYIFLLLYTVSVEESPCMI